MGFLVRQLVCYILGVDTLARMHWPAKFLSVHKAIYTIQLVQVFGFLMQIFVIYMHSYMCGMQSLLTKSQENHHYYCNDKVVQTWQ